MKIRHVRTTGNPSWIAADLLARSAWPAIPRLNGEKHRTVRGLGECFNKLSRMLLNVESESGRLPDPAASNH